LIITKKNASMAPNSLGQRLCLRYTPDSLDPTW